MKVGLSRSDILRMFAEGQSRAAISRHFHVASNSIGYHLRRAGIQPRGHRYPFGGAKYPADEMVLDYKTAERDYWLGLLMADGCIDVTGYRFWLTLKRSDGDHLNSCAAFFNTVTPIAFSRDGTARLTVTSRRLVSRLADFGVKPRKSLSAKASDELVDSRDFWRGMIDGDGSWGLARDGYPVFQMLGARPLMEQFSRYASQHCGMYAVNLHSYRRQELALFSTRGRFVRNLAHTLYSGAMVSLPRKAALAGDIILGFS